MLRTIYYVTTTVLLVGVSNRTPSYDQTIDRHCAVVRADSRASDLSPLKLAEQISSGETPAPSSCAVLVPSEIADGGGPIPPPIPLAQPVLTQIADGGGPIPPPIPLAQPVLTQIADGGGPIPPPIPLEVPDRYGVSSVRLG
jgi:hypothetical protein